MKTILTNCTLIDGTGAAPLNDAAVIIDGNTITAVGPRQELHPDGSDTADASVMDLDNHYLLPGLMNLHVHLSLVYPVGSRPPGWELTAPFRIAKMAREALEAGVTFIRTCGELRHYDLALKRAINEGLAVGPRLFCAGRGITPSGGHGSESEWYVEADGPEDFRRRARQELKAGADHVKLMVTMGLAESDEVRGKPRITLAEAQAAAETAHQFGKRICAHVGGPEGAKLAVQAGVDCLEHCYTLDDEAVEMMAAAGSYLVPTLSVTAALDFFGEMGMPEPAIQRIAELGERHRHWFARAVRAGVTPACGTDMLPTDKPNIAGFPIASVREVELMVESGISEMEALMAATSNAAEVCQVADRLGTLQAGKLADLIAVAGNPLDAIRNLREIRLVIKDGQVVRNSLA
jgi:imidazolonepropionase-like amidohydrolase